MNIEYGYILAAGLGTRMGPIGLQVPKILWPLFDFPLLEYQVRYLKNLGCKKVFINSHHLHSEVEGYLKKRQLEDVELLYEPELLGPGGCVHNLVSILGVTTGTILINNGDQFYFFDQSYLNRAMEKIKDCNAVLMGLEVAKGSHYNEIIFENDLLVDIVKAPSDRGYTTFSGMSLINIENLKVVEGKSNFFGTVAPYQTEKVAGVNIPVASYYDFGSELEYHTTCKKVWDELISDSDSPLVSLCHQVGGIDSKNIHAAEASYANQKKQVLKFLDFELTANELNYRDIKIDLTGK